MTVSFDGIKLNVPRRRGARFYMLGIVITVLEAVLTVFLYISIGAHIFYPGTSAAGTGSPSLLSYEGYLTDASGNPLGGTGTPYCFRFSIYDSPTVGSGNKLWPSGTPATTTATSTDGVFSALIGQADSLTYNFFSNDSTYLNVDVNTASYSGGTCNGSWQTLSPRQQITSSGYSQSAEAVYGALLKTDSASSSVQIGTGAGAPTPVLLDLDWKNTEDYVGQSCSTNGAIWYNSAINRTLVCNNSLIQAFGNDATTTPDAFATNANAPINNGTIIFANGNGVSWGQNGNTITASVGAPMVSFYENAQPVGAVPMAAPNNSAMLVVPFYANGNISASYIRFPATMSTQATTLATTANTTFTAGYTAKFNVVIYSRGVGANSMSLQSVASTSVGSTEQWALSANANGSQYTQSYYFSYPITGVATNYTTQTSVSQTNYSLTNASWSGFTGSRFVDVPFASSLPAGQYWLALGMSTASGANVAAATNAYVKVQSFYGASQWTATYSPMGLASNSSNQLQPGVGSYSTNAAINTVASINITNVSLMASNPRLYFQFVRIT